MATSVLWRPTTEQEQEQIQQVIAQLELPKGVHFVDLVLDTDHTGDPAVYVHFRVSTKIPLTKARLRSLSAFKDVVRSAVDTLQTGRFPYVRFVE